MIKRSRSTNWSLFETSKQNTHKSYSQISDNWYEGDNLDDYKCYTWIFRYQFAQSTYMHHVS
jgi:hypothetical protein